MKSFKTTPNPHHEAELESELRLMVKASQREPGTLACGVFKGQGVWLVVEAYRDAQAMDAHLGSAALQAFLAKVPVLLRSEPRVRKLEALEAFGFGEAR